MALVFDSLSYAKALETAGVPRDHAEAHASAVREFVMKDLVTKADLSEALELQTLRLTVRLGAMIGAAVAILATVIRLG